MKVGSVSTVLYGTDEPSPTLRQLAAGPLTAELVGSSIRKLTWHGVEVVRGIECPIRDASWGTCPSEILDETVSATADEFEVTHRVSIANGSLLCCLTFRGSAEGSFVTSMVLTPQVDYLTNRAGFVILHPLEGLAGARLAVLPSDGSATPAVFPRLISPQQVAFKIVGLVYQKQGIQTTLTFKGEVFEMEDQRNWSDASYKTYCRPLSLPMPYVLSAGRPVVQEVRIRSAGVPSVPNIESTSDARKEVRLEPIEEQVPTIALALDALSIPDSKESRLLELANVQALQIRVHAASADRVLRSVHSSIRNGDLQVELEIVVEAGHELDSTLAEVAKRCGQLSIRVARVIVLPEAYLRSYQPNGPWPEGPTPREACIAARRHFPESQIGGGVLTHFAELNRCRPDTSLCDYITHGSAAIVHAADDRSVIESLESLPHVYASARALASERTYRLGLVSIGLRSNPYGKDVAANQDQTRVPMARADPRQRGLFAAAWATGAVAATERHRVSSMALAAPVGPFGVVYRRAEWPQPNYDDHPSASVYPLFHVVRALSQMSGAPRLSLSELPDGVAGIAAEVNGCCKVVIANLSPGTRIVPLEREGIVRCLDQNTFEIAISDPDWLCASKPEARSHVELSAFGVAFIEFPGDE